jgi:hypothetical protein
MARIYISYARPDQEFAQALAGRLRDAGHGITADFDALLPGQDWRNTLFQGLKNAEVFIALLSEASLSSQFVSQEIGAARAYALESDQMLVIPIMIDQSRIPPTIQDIQVLLAPDRDIDRIVLEVSKAISNFLGRRAAKDVKAAEVAKRIEINAASYIEDAVQSQKISELRNRRFGVFWYLAGFICLIVGIAFAIFHAGFVTSASGLGWTDFGVIALKSVIVIGLLGACSKYAFSLGKSYISESLKCSDRIHAIAFGKFYLQAYGEKATWNELKEVFQHWNIDRTSTFSSLDSSQIDPQVISLISQLAKTAIGRAKG